MNGASSLTAAPPGSERFPATAAQPRVPLGWLALGLLAAALFPRVLTAIGAPRILNFAHFGAAALFLVIALPAIRGRAALQIVAGLGCLALVILLSALMNGAGVLNALLDFLLLAEPFFLLLLIVSAPPSARYLSLLRNALLGFGGANVAAALFQAFVLGQRGDFTKGLFLDQGAGHHVAGAVALTTAVILVFARSRVPFRWSILAALACVAVAVVSDSKQVIAVFLAAMAVLAAMRVRDPRRLLAYAILGPAILLFLWIIRESFPLITLALQPDRLDGGLTAKLSVIPLLLSHVDSPFQWLLGFGPGHTGGRLGQLLPTYAEQLVPLGATLSPITAAIVDLRESNPFSMVKSTAGSSAWSPFFFWAGILGDLGPAGLLTYGALWFTVWRRLCATELAQYLTLTVLIFGAVFDWPEEPAYMLYVVAAVGLEWQSSSPRPSPGSRI